MRAGILFVIAAAWMWSMVFDTVPNIGGFHVGGYQGERDGIDALGRPAAASAATAEPTATATAEPAPPPPPAPAAEAQPDEQTYTVVRGDTMYLIAQRHNVTLGALLAANPEITNPAAIEVGQAVRLPD